LNLSARKEVLMPEAARPEPSHFYRWVVLIFVSLAMFGNYYVYDCIAPVADLLAKQLGFSDSNIGLLQAIYSIPNVLMVLIGGYIVVTHSTGASRVTNAGGRNSVNLIRALQGRSR